MHHADSDHEAPLVHSDEEPHSRHTLQADNAGRVKAALLLLAALGALAATGVVRRQSLRGDVASATQEYATHWHSGGEMTGSWAASGTTGGHHSYSYGFSSNAGPSQADHGFNTNSYDCDAALNNFHLAWSAEKKVWCCNAEGKGCEHGMPSISPGEGMIWMRKQVHGHWTWEADRDDGHHRDDAYKVEQHDNAFHFHDHAGFHHADFSSLTGKYDCNAALNNFHLAWSAEKKVICCNTQGKGCEHGMPRISPGEGMVWSRKKAHGYWTWEAVQKDEHQYHEDHTSDENYDCNAALNNFQLAWSAKKKVWCCKKQGKGCQTEMPTISPGEGMVWKKIHVSGEWAWEAMHKRDVGSLQGGSGGFDCSAALDNFEAAWSPEKKAWCCEREGKGCPSKNEIVGHMGEKGPDCNEDLEHFHERWSADKKAWCCTKEGKGCEQHLAENGTFDCEAAIDNFHLAWSDAKKGWCCKEALKGCEGPLPPDFSPGENMEWQRTWGNGFWYWKAVSLAASYDCDENFNHWHSEWSSGKKTWCCRNHYKGCQGDEEPDFSPGEGKQWEKMQGFGYHYWIPKVQAPTSYDCDSHLMNSHTAWSEDQKQWCCEKHLAGCEGPVEPNFSPGPGTKWERIVGDGYIQWVAVPEKEPAALPIDETTTTTTTLPAPEKTWDCENELSDFIQKWPVDKKKFCCLHELKGCDGYHPPKMSPGTGKMWKRQQLGNSGSYWQAVPFQMEDGARLRFSLMEPDQANHCCRHIADNCCLDDDMGKKFCWDREEDKLESCCSADTATPTPKKQPNNEGGDKTEEVVSFFNEQKGLGVDVNFVARSSGLLEVQWTRGQIWFGEWNSTCSGYNWHDWISPEDFLKDKDPYYTATNPYLGREPNLFVRFDHSFTATDFADCLMGPVFENCGKVQPCHKTCEKFDCGDGWDDKLPKASIVCSQHVGDECTVDECCERTTCSKHECGAGLVGKTDMVAIECATDFCGDDECCDQVTCSDYACGPGWSDKSEKSSINCTDDECTNTECCDKVTCMRQPDEFTCGNGWVDAQDKDLMVCANDSCTDEECCTRVTCGSSDFACGEGWTPKPQMASIKCDRDDCAVVECCQRSTCHHEHCGAGWSPKPNMDDINCKEDSCEVAECCDLITCHNFSCGDGLVGKKAKAGIQCEEDNCTSDECCDTVACSLPCGPGKTPKRGEKNILCHEDECTEDECCDVSTCGNHDYFCRAGLIDKANMSSISCKEDECSDGECCAPVTCASYDCGAGWVNRSDMPSINCAADTCTNSDCCDRVTCEAFECGHGLTPKAGQGDIDCKEDECTAAECCNTVTCGDYTCDDGWISKVGQDIIECQNDTCTDSECCIRVTCNEYLCGPGYKDMPNKSEIGCQTDVCGIGECCDQVTCKSHTCSHGWTKKGGDVSSFPCADDECTDSECCIATCEGFTGCDEAGGWKDKPDMASVTCTKDTCTKQECCVPPPPLKSCRLWGDPHVITFDGSEFVFYREGQFWVVNHTKLRIQGQFEATEWTKENDKTDYSSMTGLVITGELMNGSKLSIGKLDGNGENGEILCDGKQLFTSGFGLAHCGPANMTYSSNGALIDAAMGFLPHKVVHVYLPERIHIQANRWPNFMNGEITMSAYDGMDGICGNFNGDPKDDTGMYIHSRFGMGVQDKDRLFDKTFKLNYPTAKPNDRRCPPNLEEQASKICKTQMEHEVMKACKDKCWSFSECMGDYCASSKSKLMSG